jgi:hypothetical protein
LAEDSLGHMVMVADGRRRDFRGDRQVAINRYGRAMRLRTGRSFLDKPTAPCRAGLGRTVASCA